MEHAAHGSLGARCAHLEVHINPAPIPFSLALTVSPARDIHFYMAHRMLHVRALYKFVHALHHRNADPEPFSGISMHPGESRPSLFIY